MILHISIGKICVRSDIHGLESHAHVVVALYHFRWEISAVSSILTLVFDEKEIRQSVLRLQGHEGYNTYMFGAV